MTVEEITHVSVVDLRINGETIEVRAGSVSRFTSDSVTQVVKAYGKVAVEKPSVSTST